MAFFSCGKFLIELAYSNLKNYRYKIVWQKNLACGFLNSHKMPLRAHEDILIFYRKLPTYNPQFSPGKPYSRTSAKNEGRVYAKKKSIFRTNNGVRYPQDIFKSKIDYGGHETGKPTKLLSWLIKTYTNEGETVLDPTIGSGSTAVACIETGRNFIGFELDEHYFEVANKRISEALAKKQQELF